MCRLIQEKEGREREGKIGVSGILLLICRESSIGRVEEKRAQGSALLGGTCTAGNDRKEKRPRRSVRPVALDGVAEREGKEGKNGRSCPLVHCV